MDFQLRSVVMPGRRSRSLPAVSEGKITDGERMPGKRSARSTFCRKELFIPLTFRLYFVGSPRNQDHGDCIQSSVDAPEKTRLRSSAYPGPGEGKRAAGSGQRAAGSAHCFVRGGRSSRSPSMLVPEERYYLDLVSRRTLLDTSEPPEQRPCTQEYGWKI